MSSELVARAVLHRIADAQPEITLEDGAAVVTESVAIRAMEDFAERAFSDIETLRASLEALEAEVARKDDALRRVEWALTKQSLTDKERVQDALSVARRAREGGNADGSQ